MPSTPNLDLLTELVEALESGALEVVVKGETVDERLAFLAEYFSDEGEE